MARIDIIALAFGKNGAQLERGPVWSVPEEQRFFKFQIGTYLVPETRLGFDIFRDAPNARVSWEQSVRPPE